jgi:hypothetical protein
MLINTLLRLTACAFLFLAASLSNSVLGETLGHNDIVRLYGNATYYDRLWLPRLSIENGCHSYPAVDKLGNIGGGLKPTGTETGLCTDGGNGQAYSRTRCWTIGDDKVCATIYAWYFPKDMFMWGELPIPFVGHRHDWESVVVWTQNSEFAGAAFSQHGDWRRYDQDHSELVIDGKILRVKYARDMGTHVVKPSIALGARSPLVSWERLPQSIQSVLESWRGETNFPAGNRNHLVNMMASVPDSLCDFFAFSSPACY